MLKPHLALVLFLLTVLNGGAALQVFAQNLVPNGDFDTDLSGWTPIPLMGPGTVTVSHVPGLDATGNATSGSLLVEVDLTVSEATPRLPVLRASPCFQPPNPLDTQMSFGYMYSGAITTGSLNLALCEWQNPDCTELLLCGGQPLASGGSGFEVFTAEGQFFSPAVQGITIEVLASNMLGLPVVGSARLDKVYFREGFSGNIPPLQAHPTAVPGGGLVVDFAGQASGGVSPFEPKFFWDFGDGMTSTEQNPTHSFLAPGQYTVALTVDSGFEQASEAIVVQVPTSRVVEVPTLSGLGSALLVVLLVTCALVLLRW
jgi:hypothetical protein